MSCANYEKLIHRSLDREIEAGEERLLMAHLEECAACSREYEKTKKLKALFIPETVAPPSGMRSRIMNAVAAERTGGQAVVIPLFRRAALAALVILAVSAALFFGDLGTLTASDGDSSVHYEDVFSGRDPGETLDVLLRTQNPKEALRLILQEERE